GRQPDDPDLYSLPGPLGRALGRDRGHTLWTPTKLLTSCSPCDRSTIQPVGRAVSSRRQSASIDVFGAVMSNSGARAYVLRFKSGQPIQTEETAMGNRPLSG